MKQITDYEIKLLKEKLEEAKGNWLVRAKAGDMLELAERVLAAFIELRQKHLLRTT